MSKCPLFYCENVSAIIIVQVVVVHANWVSKKRFYGYVEVLLKRKIYMLYILYIYKVYIYIYNFGSMPSGNTYHWNWPAERLPEKHHFCTFWLWWKLGTIRSTRHFVARRRWPLRQIRSPVVVVYSSGFGYITSASEYRCAVTGEVVHLWHEIWTTIIINFRLKSEES